MATMKVGTEEVLKIMFGTEEVSSLAIGEETIPVDGGGGSDYLKMPLTFEALDNGNISISGQIERSICYSINGGEKTTLQFTSASNTTQTISFNTGDIIEITIPNDKTAIETTSSYLNFKATAQCNIYGNIMSLCYVDYVTKNTIPNANCFYRLFYQNTNIVSAENLILPATTLAQNCYYNMFRGCTRLTKAPDLPATTLAMSCYSNMFNGCTSLTKTPDLPATTLAQSCYVSMFNGCTSLTTAPVLPAPTTISQAYSYMFSGCRNLSYVKCLLTTNGDTGGTLDWLKNVSATGTFVKANGAVWTSGQSGIPDGWAVQEV